MSEEETIIVPDPECYRLDVDDHEMIRNQGKEEGAPTMQAMGFLY